MCGKRTPRRHFGRSTLCMTIVAAVLAALSACMNGAQTASGSSSPVPVGTADPKRPASDPMAISGGASAAPGVPAAGAPTPAAAGQTPSVPTGSASAPTSTGSPAATGTTAAAATSSTTAGRRVYGFSAGDVSDLSPAALDARLAAIAATGATWVRFDAAWLTVQPQGPQNWSWDTFDRVVQTARDHGLGLLPILDAAPAWARVSGCTNIDCPPAQVADFTRFAAAAVARYSPLGVKVWEIWNEPNLAVGWAPNPDPSAYATLLRQTSAAIHASDPTAQVLVGGLGPAQTGAGQVAPEEFLRRVYDVAGAGAFDGVAMHPYSFPALPSDIAQLWSGWSQMTLLRATMVAHGDSAKPVWITEFGAPTSGPGAQATLANRRYAEHPDHVDEDFQRESAANALDLVARTSWIRGFFWYNFNDLGTNPNDAEHHYGVIRSDGATKPAYDVLRSGFTAAR